MYDRYWSPVPQGAEWVSQESKRDAVETTIATGTVVRPDARRFYLWMAILFVLIAFGGFTPSYWARIAAGNFCWRLT